MPARTARQRPASPRRAQPSAADPDTKRRALRIARALARTWPEAVCALEHESPYQLLVATILSAQCTDKRVNMVTPELFRRYPKPADLSASKIFIDDTPRTNPHVDDGRADDAELAGVIQSVDGAPLRAKT